MDQKRKTGQDKSENRVVFEGHLLMAVCVWVSAIAIGILWGMFNL